MPLTRTIVYTYDNLYRLTDADYSTGEDYAYAYDPVGNRLQQITAGGDTTAYLRFACGQSPGHNPKSPTTKIASSLTPPPLKLWIGCIPQPAQKSRIIPRKSGFVGRGENLGNC